MLVRTFVIEQILQTLVSPKKISPFFCLSQKAVELAQMQIRSSLGGGRAIEN